VSKSKSGSQPTLNTVADRGNSLSISLPRVGDTVLFFTGGDTSNDPLPLVVTSIQGNMLRGMIVENTRCSFTRGFIRNVNDTNWIDEHKKIAFDHGLWGTYDDIP